MLVVLHALDVDVIDRLFELQQGNLGVDEFPLQLLILLFKLVQFATQAEVVIKQFLSPGLLDL